jgi:hypothetical protein
LELTFNKIQKARCPVKIITIINMGILFQHGIVFRKKCFTPAIRKPMSKPLGVPASQSPLCSNHCEASSSLICDSHFPFIQGHIDTPSVNYYPIAKQPEGRMGIECPKCNTEFTSDSKLCRNCNTRLSFSKEIPFTEILEKAKEELASGSISEGRYTIIEDLGKGSRGKVNRTL